MTTSSYFNYWNNHQYYSNFNIQNQYTCDQVVVSPKSELSVSTPSPNTFDFVDQCKTEVLGFDNNVDVNQFQITPPRFESSRSSDCMQGNNDIKVTTPQQQTTPPVVAPATYYPWMKSYTGIEKIFI